MPRGSKPCYVAPTEPATSRRIAVATGTRWQALTNSSRCRTPARQPRERSFLIYGRAWRWRWDLNPRRAFTLTRFRGVRARPLRDSTAGEPSGPLGGSRRTPTTALRTRPRAHRRLLQGDG